MQDKDVRNAKKMHRDINTDTKVITKNQIHSIPANIQLCKFSFYYSYYCSDITCGHF